MGRDAADVAHGAVLRATQHSRAQRVSGHPGGHPGPYTPAVTEPTSLTRPRRRCYSGLSSHRPAAGWPQVSLARPPQRSSPRSGLVATKSPQPPGAQGPGRYSKRQPLGPGQRLREGRVAPAGATQPLNWWLRVENIRRQPRPTARRPAALFRAQQPGAYLSPRLVGRHAAIGRTAAAPPYPGHTPEP